MNVLILGPPDSPLTPIVQSHGDTPREWEGPLTLEDLLRHDIGFAISYRYLHRVQQDVLQRLLGRIINLHISLLPWNRGVDPNLWSFVENTPKGVTIHHIDAGLDTGDIIYQQSLTFNDAAETLASSYKKLNDAIIALFSKHWLDIRAGLAPRHPQPPGGNYHRWADRGRVWHLLAKKQWETPVASLTGHVGL